MLKAMVLKYLLLVKDLAYTYKLKHQYRNQIKRNSKRKFQTLNNIQKREIKNFYLKYDHKVKTYWHEFYFSSNQIYSVEYIPEDMFHALLSKEFNQMRQWPSLLDKNLLGNLFKEFKQPKVLLKNINGFYYIDNQLVSKEKAITIINKENRKMVIKPSIESGLGKGVISFSVLKGRTNINNLSLKELLQNYNKDFIVQLIVNQNETIKSLNPSSLNTLRIFSYLNNNGVNILSVIIRIGKDGSFTDNCATGGIACGINKNGKLNMKGYLNDGTERTRTDSGILFEGIQIPGYKELIHQVKQMHLIVPYFRFISWDIGIDSLDHPVLIEYNTYHQDISIHQLANGPLFGKFTHEILSHPVK